MLCSDSIRNIRYCVIALLFIWAPHSQGEFGPCVQIAHVATYNTMLRRGGPAWEVEDTCRAQQLALLLPSFSNTNVLALQEMWDSDIGVILNSLDLQGFAFVTDTATGVLLASKSPISSSHKEEFEEEEGDEWWGGIAGVHKGFWAITTTVGGVPIRVIATHTQAEGPETRAAQFRQIRKFVDRFPDRPIIFMGDFNVSPNRPQYQLLTADIFSDFKDATRPFQPLITLQCKEETLDAASCFPSFSGTQLDYVFTRDIDSIVLQSIDTVTRSLPISSTTCGEEISFLSDHRFVETTLKFHVNNSNQSCSNCEPGFELMFVDGVQRCVKTQIDRECRDCPPNAVCYQSWLGVDSSGTDKWGSCELRKCEPGYHREVEDCQLFCANGPEFVCSTLDRRRDSQTLPGLPPELAKVHDMCLLAAEFRENNITNLLNLCTIQAILSRSHFKQLNFQLDKIGRELGTLTDKASEGENENDVKKKEMP